MIEEKISLRRVTKENAEFRCYWEFSYEYNDPKGNPTDKETEMIIIGLFNTEEVLDWVKDHIL